MKVYFALVSSFILSLATAAKVKLCHIPPGNPGNAHTIEVNERAVPAHLANGDYEGECDEFVCEDMESKTFFLCDGVCYSEDDAGDQACCTRNECKGGLICCGGICAAKEDCDLEDCKVNGDCDDEWFCCFGECRRREADEGDPEYCEETPNCFTADALVTMSDGTKKPIANVHEGEHVLTGDGSVGLVTKILVHTIGETVPVATISTTDGVLVGTTYHPIHVGNGRWIKMGDAVGINVSLEERFVDLFYNLEINGHDLLLPARSHSYAVNGIIASGFIHEPDMDTRVLSEELQRMCKPCFTADALVTMADGTKKRIVDVQEGDRVTTGTGSGAGLVTEVLVSNINMLIPVTTLHTPDGVLVGTPEHPILVEDEWMEMGQAVGIGVSLEERFVDILYNLEVDGQALVGESSQSYVVNGVVASGLGDTSKRTARIIANTWAREEFYW